MLLSLLRSNGTMRVGLYSKTARRPVVEARALIAEHGYRATAEDIRTFRQTILRNWNEPRWHMLIKTVDFYSVERLPRHAFQCHGASALRSLK